MQIIHLSMTVFCMIQVFFQHFLINEKQKNKLATNFVMYIKPKFLKLTSQ